MYYFLTILFILLVSFDQLTKQMIYVASNATIGYSIPVIGDFFKFTYIENHGGIFGLFQGNIIVFTVVSSVLIIYLLYTEWKNFLNASLLKKIAIVIIAAGAAGNMIDRYYRGYVIDMIDFRGIWQFIFNVADVYIHIGLYTLIADYLISRKKGEKK